MFYLDVASWVELFNQLFYHPYGHKSDDQAEIIEYCYFSLSLILIEYFFLEILTVKSLDNKKKSTKWNKKACTMFCVGPLLLFHMYHWAF